MFPWNSFTEIFSHLFPIFLGDEDLKALLKKELPPFAMTDIHGKPKPSGILVAEHPDITNFIRVLSIRKSRAESEQDIVYVKYAENSLRFLQSCQGEHRLLIVLIATNFGGYECLYFPTENKLHVERTDHLEGRSIA